MPRGQYGCDIILPVPTWLDDLMVDQITYNSWCGEPLAVQHFNRDSEFRKIESTPFFANVTRMGTRAAGCHILDHPVRSGDEVPQKGGASLFKLRKF